MCKVRLPFLVNELSHWSQLNLMPLWILSIWSCKWSFLGYCLPHSSQLNFLLFPRCIVWTCVERFCLLDASWSHSLHRCFIVLIWMFSSLVATILIQKYNVELNAESKYKHCRWLKWKLFVLSHDGMMDYISPGNCVHNKVTAILHGFAALISLEIGAANWRCRYPACR